MPFISAQVPIADKQGTVTQPWFGFFQDLLRAVTPNTFALAAQPVLGVKDVGYLGLVSDFGHVVRWTGSAWEFAPGDPGNGFLAEFAVAPQQPAYWGLCDGSAYTYLVVGATLTTASFTTAVIASTYFRR